MCIRCTVMREKGRDATIEEIYSYMSSGGPLFKESRFKGFESLDNKWVKVYIDAPYFSTPSHLLAPSYGDGWLRNLICSLRLYEIGYCCDKKICYHLYEIEPLMSLKDQILQKIEWSDDTQFSRQYVDSETLHAEIYGLGEREIARFYVKDRTIFFEFEKIMHRVSDCQTIHPYFRYVTTPKCDKDILLNSDYVRGIDFFKATHSEINSLLKRN